MFRVLTPISRRGQTIPAGTETRLEWLDDRGVKQLIERGAVEAIDGDTEAALRAIAEREAEAKRVGVGDEVPQDTPLSPENLGEEDEDAEGDEQPGEMWSEADKVTTLRAYAKRHGVELASGDNKPEILDKLRAERGDFEITPTIEDETEAPDGAWVTNNPADMSTKAE